MTCLALLLPFGAYASTYNTGYVNMTATYPTKAESFTVICYAADGSHETDDVLPLYGLSENCVKSDVIRKSTGQEVASKVGHGCHMIWGVIPYVHPFPSVSAGIGCSGHIVPAKGQAALKSGDGAKVIKKLFDQSPLYPQPSSEPQPSDSSNH